MSTLIPKPTQLIFRSHPQTQPALPNHLTTRSIVSRSFLHSPFICLRLHRTRGLNRFIEQDSALPISTIVGDPHLRQTTFPTARFGGTSQRVG
jgi:hypothetical protein